jgi:hypothetical protein
MSTQNEETVFYVACPPDHPDEAFAACVDKPEWQASTAKDVADWIRRGALIKRVSASEGRAMMDRWLERRDKERLSENT